MLYYFDLHSHTTFLSCPILRPYPYNIAYYMSLAPLILEESRCILAHALNKVSQHSVRSADTFILELTSFEEKYTKLDTTHRKYAPLIFNLQIIGSKMNLGFGADSNSAKWTRPGSVVLLRRKGSDGNDFTTSILACINPIAGPQPTSSSSSPNSTVSLMIFRRADFEASQLYGEENTLFYATPMTTLISQVRQMEACLRMVKVSFLRKLLGQKTATHTRFGNSSDEDQDEDEIVMDKMDDNGADAGCVFQEGYYVENDDAERSVDNDNDDERSTVCDMSLSGILGSIPTLNNTQERAAKLFLQSPPESLILVQG